MTIEQTVFGPGFNAVTNTVPASCYFGSVQARPQTALPFHGTRPLPRTRRNACAPACIFFCNVGVWQKRPAKGLSAPVCLQSIVVRNQRSHSGILPKQWLAWVLQVDGEYDAAAATITCLAPAQSVPLAAQLRVSLDGQMFSADSIVARYGGYAGASLTLCVRGCRHAVMASSPGLC